MLSSTGTPGILVDRRSLLLLGDNENLIVSPKLMTWEFIIRTSAYRWYFAAIAIQTRMSKYYKLTLIHKIKTYFHEQQSCKEKNQSFMEVEWLTIATCTNITTPSEQKFMYISMVFTLLLTIVLCVFYPLSFWCLSHMQIQNSCTTNLFYCF